MRITLVFVLAILVAGCAPNGYRKFYKSYGDPKALQDIQVLTKDEAPAIYTSDDFNRDARILVSKGYYPIGYSEFNGLLEPQENVVAQARRVSALIVLTNQRYTNTQTTTVPLFIPNNSTTHSSGTAYGYGGSASYLGSSTTYGTSVVPITSQQMRFDQGALYFIKSTAKPRFGVQLINLTPELRQKLERNTGAIIDIVREDSPAFLANLLPGDILIEINQAEVRSAEHAIELMKLVSPEVTDCSFSIIRNGQVKKITLHLNAG